jgi:hypothetical protein
MSWGIMAVDEQKLRRSLHDRLEAALGTDEAALLMEMKRRRGRMAGTPERNRP